MIKRIFSKKQLEMVLNYDDLIKKIDEGIFISNMLFDTNLDKTKLFKQIKLNIDLKVELSYCYIFGIGTNVNLQKAFKMLTNLDTSKAYYLLGYCYYHKLFKPNKTEEKTFIDIASDYLTKAAEDGFNLAYELLSDIYVFVKEDYELGYIYTKNAVSLGNIVYRNTLAYLYYEGLGCEKDYQKVYILLNENYYSKNVDAIFNFALCYFEGIYVEQNYQKAYKYFLEAKNLGSLRAIEVISHMHEYALGVKKSLEKAFDGYLFLLEQTDNGFYYDKIATFYALGQGIEEDFIKAEEYFLEAIKRNHIPSYHNLGLFYISINKIKKGKKYIEKAKALNYQEAIDYNFDEI